MTYTPTAWVDYGVPCINAANLNNMEAGIDRAQGDVMVLRGLTANIPASDPLLIGRLYIETDLLQRVWRDNGAGWDLVPTGGTWQLIAETILGAPAASVTFAAIPGTYRHLALQAMVRTDRPGVDVDLINWRANGDSGNNYDWLWFMLYENVDTGAAMRAQTSAEMGYVEAATSLANTFAPVTGLWLFYADTDWHKPCKATTASNQDNDADIDLREFVSTAWWRSTAAITSLTFLPANGPNFIANSRFTLYGIA